MPGSMNKNPPCPKCESGNVINAGKILEKQRYRCKTCGRQFTRLSPQGKPSEIKREAVELYATGLSMRSIARKFGVSATSVWRWIRAFAEKTYAKPEPTDADVVEIDEMWHYIDSKKNKLWTWKAHCRDTGQLIDWKCENMAQRTLSRMEDKVILYRQLECL